MMDAGRCMSHSIEFLRDKLARVRRGHTQPKGTEIESVEYGEVEKEGFTQIYVNGALGCVVTRRLGNVEYIVWSDDLTKRVEKRGGAVNALSDRRSDVKVVEEKWERGVFKEMGEAVEYELWMWDLLWTRDNKWHEHATEFYLEAEPVWPGVGFQLEKARRGMDFIETGMREYLQEIIDYELKERCDALATLKASLRERLNAVDGCKQTAAGMQTWKAAVQTDLETFTGSVGLPEYSGGEGGAMPRLVATEMNRMKDFVNKKINACVQAADGLRIKRVQEDAWTAKTPQADMRTLLCRMQTLI